MEKRIIVTAFIVAAVLAVLNGCFYPVPYGARLEPPRPTQGPVRTVVDPGDVPPLFTSCRFGHSQSGFMTRSERGVLGEVTERNNRVCEDVYWTRPHRGRQR